MTYFGFLARFLCAPILLLAALAWIDRRRGRSIPRRLLASSPFRVLAVLVSVAVIYTTPWDNYLVATGVWWYDPALVTGLLLGWVPVEEYTFFVLETIFVGLWTLALARRLSPGQTAAPDRSLIRWMAAVSLVPAWTWSIGVLITGWQPGTYLALLLAWALPPVALQLAFGADLLWRDRRLVLPAILVPAIYLSAADALALGTGTWTINPEQSLHLLIGGVLPVEELAFFLITSTLLVFGMVLALAEEGRARLADYISFVRRWVQHLTDPGFRIPDPREPRTSRSEE
jgi:lycopene cyclase domain-containing protein